MLGPLHPGDRLTPCVNMPQMDDPDWNADTLRQSPVGEDSHGNRYFYFSMNHEDCRLYKESPPRKRSGRKYAGRDDEALWFTVCTTLEEMVEFTDKMGTKRGRREKALHAYLSKEILPKLVETAAARKRAAEKAAKYEAMPRKRSSRIVVSIGIADWPVMTTRS